MLTFASPVPSFKRTCPRNSNPGVVAFSDGVGTAVGVTAPRTLQAANRNMHTSMLSERNISHLSRRPGLQFDDIPLRISDIAPRNLCAGCRLQRDNFTDRLPACIQHCLLGRRHTLD